MHLTDAKQFDQISPMKDDAVNFTVKINQFPMPTAHESMVCSYGIDALEAFQHKINVVYCSTSKSCDPRNDLVALRPSASVRRRTFPQA